MLKLKQTNLMILLKKKKILNLKVNSNVVNNLEQNAHVLLLKAHVLLLNAHVLLSSCIASVKLCPHFETSRSVKKIIKLGYHLMISYFR